MTPPFSPQESQSAEDSYERCQQGATCMLTPMAMIVVNKKSKSTSFDFRSWVLYDGRDTLGQRYIALMNEQNDPVCEGFYTSIGINRLAPMAMTCFPKQSMGRGEFRFHGHQADGQFVGKPVGTGLFETEEERVYFVHGVTPDESRRRPFHFLWNKYGGHYQRELVAAETRYPRVPSLPRLAKGKATATTAESR